MHPKHHLTKKFIEIGLFNNISTFSELEQRISNLPEHDRGNAFEVFAEAYFATQKLSQASDVWSFEQVPISIRNELGLSMKDMGVDGIILTQQGDYNAYQVKFRTKRSSLRWEELSTFMGLSDRVRERVLFTNSSDLPSLMADRTDFYAIKGNDLDRLEKDDFQAIEEWLKKGHFAFKRKTPLDHQKVALDNIHQALKSSHRTTVVMACGTGKTLVSLWLAETIKAQTVLILVPSLALLRQTLHEWLRETVWEDFTYLCVCSDPSVDKGTDDILLKQSDLDFPVCTDKNVVREFFNGSNTKNKLLFSTYQSAPVVAQGLPEGFSFDLGIFDEAHKTAGREGTKFSFALDDTNISLQKRLFLTATPKHYDISKKDKEGDFRLVYSMDDTEIYGQISHTLSFGTAAEQGIISKYKVVISVITSQEVTKHILNHGEVVVEGDVQRAINVAIRLAVKNAVEKNGIKHVFTFHNSVKSAQSLTSSTGEGIVNYLNEFATYHVNGTMPTSKRDLLLRSFKEAPKAIMSNARCLTEGVDVPAVDMVVFISPRKSRVDIVQAIGRAMRKSPGKEFGYILLPIFLEVANGENLEEALVKTDFDDIWNVLEAMKEQDCILTEIIRQIRENIGRKIGSDDSKLRELVEVIGPEISITLLKDTIISSLIDRLGVTWDERYGQLIHFKERYGHCDVPQKYFENKALATWVGFQRNQFKLGKLSQERLKKLNFLGFKWEPRDESWEEMYQELLKFQKKHNHCNVPKGYTENPSLGTWVSKQRDKIKANKLSKERIQKLQEIGFVFDPANVAWEETFEALRKYKNENGHCNVPGDYPENEPLGKWVARQRNLYKKNHLQPERVERLEQLGFVWNILDFEWEKMFNTLRKFKEENGHCFVPAKYDLNPQLGSWVSIQRDQYRKGKMSEDRLNVLNKIGFCWDPKEAEWQEMFNALCKFKKENGHCNVPSTFCENSKLARWVINQRVIIKNKKMNDKHLKLLEEIGFVFDPLNERWETMYQALQKFKNDNGHCNVPQDYMPCQELGHWVTTQRSKYRKNKLNHEKIRKLEEIGFIWDLDLVVLNQRLEELRLFKETTGHCNVPKEYSKNPPLGAWLAKQRVKYNKNKLPADIIAILEEIGIIWKPQVRA